MVTSDCAQTIADSPDLVKLIFLPEAGRQKAWRYSKKKAPAGQTPSSAYTLKNVLLHQK